MKLVLVGIPGAGKSTQGNLLSKQLKIPYLSTGHIFREIAKEKTQLGRYVKEVMSSGSLIPDDKTIEIVKTYLSRPEYKKGFIIDGFPRTITQAKKFADNVEKVIYLEIPDKEALWRLAHRSVDRDDDTVKAIRRRIDVFHNLTEPVIKYYEKKDKVALIDGTQTVEQVNEDVLKSIGKQWVKDQIQAWKQDEKSIIAIVGLPGAGKTEAANFFKEKELPVIYFGKAVNEEVEKRKLNHVEEAHKLVREELRAMHGNEAMAKLNEKKIKAALKKHMMVAIDGLRSWEEYTYLKRVLPNVNIYILALYADKKVRYRRIQSRATKSELFGEERDVNELIGTNMGATIAFADFTVKNNYSLEDLHDKLEDVYREVYFT